MRVYFIKYQYHCRVCGERVAAKDLREHLEGHNPNADNLSWEEVRDCYTIE